MWAGNPTHTPTHGKGGTRTRTGGGFVLRGSCKEGGAEEKKELEWSKKEVVGKEGEVHDGGTSREIRERIGLSLAGRSRLWRGAARRRGRGFGGAVSEKLRVKKTKDHGPFC